MVPIQVLGVRQTTNNDGMWYVTLGDHKLALRVAQDGDIPDRLLLEDVLRGKLPAFADKVRAWLLTDTPVVAYEFRCCFMLLVACCLLLVACCCGGLLVATARVALLARGCDQGRLHVLVE